MTFRHDEIPVSLNLVHVLVLFRNFYLFYEGTDEETNDGTDDDRWRDEWMKKTTIANRQNQEYYIST